MGALERARAATEHARRRSEKSPFARSALDLTRPPFVVDFDGGAEDRIAKFAFGTAVAADFEAVFKAADLGAAEQRLVVGVVMEPVSTPDTQGDVIAADEIRRTAAKWKADFGTIGLQHQDDVTDKVQVVESWITPVDVVIGGQTAVAGSWLLALKVLDDDIWAAVKAGEITGFSIGGTASRRAVA